MLSQEILNCHNPICFVNFSWKMILKSSCCHPTISKDQIYFDLLWSTTLVDWNREHEEQMIPLSSQNALWMSQRSVPANLKESFKISFCCPTKHENNLTSLFLWECRGAGDAWCCGGLTSEWEGPGKSHNWDLYMFSPCRDGFSPGISFSSSSP